MKILVSGASGLIGSALIPVLRSTGNEVVFLKRAGSGKPQDVKYDLEKNNIESQKLEGLDAVVHLAGENIAEHWSDAQKELIVASRVNSTELLADAIAKLESPPKVLINASAIGFYGNRGDQTVDETSAKGSGFLSDVVYAWESALQPAIDKGVRVVKLRTGVVLSDKGGALAQMLPPFRFGLGGKIGSGEQYMSWIALDDVIGAIHHVLVNENISGAVNLVAPHPIRNVEFTKTLGKVLHRPTFFSVPALGVKLFFGEMGEELLLASTKVEPKVLLQSGYPFLYPHLTQALEHVLGRK